MDIQECIDFISRHFGNDNLVYIVQNDDHDERQEVEAITHCGLLVQTLVGYKEIEIIRWSELKKDYHLRAYRFIPFEDEDELVETLELNKLELKNQLIKTKN